MLELKQCKSSVIVSMSIIWYNMIYYIVKEL